MKKTVSTLAVLFSMLFSLSPFVGCSDSKNTGGKTEGETHENIMNDEVSRFEFRGKKVEIKHGSMLDNGTSRFTYVSGWTPLPGDDVEDQMVDIQFEGRPTIGKKSSVTITIRGIEKCNGIYSKNNISNFEVLKNQSWTNDEPGIIWIVADINGERLVFVTKYKME